MTDPSTTAGGERVAAPERALAELLDVKTVADLCDASTRHIYRLADAGKMPAPIRLGSLVRWSRRSISDWIAAGCPAVRNVTANRRAV
jgi:excisionase family DNA binding protein